MPSDSSDLGYGVRLEAALQLSSSNKRYLIIRVGWRVSLQDCVTKKIRSKERTDAENRWSVAEIAGGRLWLHPEEEETMQKNIWLEKMNKEDDKRKIGRIASKSDDQECGRQYWTLA